MSRNGLAAAEQPRASRSHDLAALMYELVQRQIAIGQHHAALFELQNESVRLQQQLIECVLGTRTPDPDVSVAGLAAVVTGRALPRSLTCREREVATLIGKGLTNRQIAEQLVIAERTADTHVQNLLAKLGCASRSQVAAVLPADADA